MVRGHSTHDTRMAPRSRAKAGRGKPAPRSSARGRLVQAKAGRSGARRRTRPASRDRPARRSPGGRGQQPSDRAGSGQGGRKN